MFFDITKQYRPESGPTWGRSILIHAGRYRVPEDLTTAQADQAIADGAGHYAALVPTLPPQRVDALARWAGRTAIVAATGPSLVPSLCDRVMAAGHPIIAVNDAYKRIPTADILYACDGEWWDHHQGAPGFAGERWSSHCANANEADDDKTAHAVAYGLHLIAGRHIEAFSADPTFINYGDNSGYQAVNLAIVLGATRVLMVGFDMRIVKDKAHFFGDHPAGLRNVNKYQQFMEHFDRAALALPAGVTVINCTPKSALKCFPLMDLAEALNAP